MLSIFAKFYEKEKKFLSVMGMVWLFLFPCIGSSELPSVLYLTWIHDPTTTMTVQWHTSKDQKVSRVFYRPQGQEVWLKQEGNYTPLVASDLLVHTAHLDQLHPDTTYEFTLFSEEEERCQFRTLPSDLTRPVKFVMGGDAYFYLSKFKAMNKMIAKVDPDFVVIGGDIAYTVNSRAVFKGKGWELSRWRRFLQEWKKQMVTSDGLMIPFLPVVGNHDIKATSLSGKHGYFLFYELFALPEKGVSYRTIDVGTYLSLFLLDSGHSFYIEGQQTEWLKNALADRQKQKYKFASYHIAAYPSVYPFEGGVPKRLRYYWSPLFDRYDLQVAFEHHNHAYKRTFPIKRGRIDPRGVIYLGDGSWGVSPRKPKDLWYLEKKEQVNAVFVVTLAEEKSEIQAIDIKGQVIDDISIAPSHAEEMTPRVTCHPY